MKKNTDLAWERWGRQDPYFGVLTDQKYRKAGIAHTKAEFFESGQQHITTIMTQIESHFGPVSRESTLDFGCGVGRVLVPLSKAFRSVTGLDVSRSMLGEAARNLAERKIANVQLLESDDAVSRLGDRTFDFIHSYIVLQHIRPQRGYEIIRNLMRHLSPHGAFFVHVSCRRNLSLARKLVYLCKNRVPHAYILFNILQGRRAFEPSMEMNEYDTGRLLGVFQQSGFQEVMTRLEIHGNCLTAGFFSRK